jgi:hypothetical protein
MCERNDQWRLIFQWLDRAAIDAQLVDYHEEAQMLPELRIPAKSSLRSSCDPST